MDRVEGIPGLKSRNFRKIALNGFGDPYNAYPHAMTWFKDHLYVGTTRANLHYRGRWRQEKTPELLGQLWPVEIPEKLFDIDLRAQIWRYDPRSDKWEMVFISPLGQGVDGFDVPICIGFRSMTPYQGLSDSEPALYVPTWGSHQTPQAVMLRSVDGASFEIVSEPGLGFPDPYKPRAVRGLLPFKGRLFASPAVGAKRAEPNTSGFMVILETRDPAQGNWKLACEPHFGDFNNLTVFHMVEFNDHLYAGTLNVNEGFQVWKTTAEGEPPYRWTKVISHGAYRGRFNQFALRMFPFKGKLYIGTAIQDGGADPDNKVAAPPELIRLNPDDTWDLIVGEPRMTPNGLKVPLSGMGPGFGNPFSGYFWALCEHEGWLYLGSFEWTLSLRYVKQDLWPEWLRHRLTEDSIEKLIHGYGGCDLWRSRDGLRWVPVTLNAMGNYYSYGIRNMVSTKYGLFVGFTNPYGPRTAVKRAAGWRYEDNPMGGLEVWLGSRDYFTPPANEPGMGPVVSDSRPAGKDSILEDGERRLAEVLRRFYLSSGFRHFGYWTVGTRNPRAACENLMEEILAFMRDRRGTILDIGCGMGETTHYLARYFEPGAVTGVVADKKDIKTCMRNAPNLRFIHSSLPDISVPSGSHDLAIWARGNRPLGARAALLRETFRVLKPGGQLACYDVISDAGVGDGMIKDVWNLEESIASVEEYERIMKEVGFRDTVVVDVTERSLTFFQQYLAHYFNSRQLTDELDDDLRDRMKTHLRASSSSYRCVLVSGYKPL